MPHYIVPGAAAIGAVDPEGGPANYFLNYTGSSGWVIHLSGGGWRFLSGKDATDTASSETTQATTTTRPPPPPPPLLFSDGTAPTVPPGASPDGHCYGKCDGILSDDPTINPLFHSWNKVRTHARTHARTVRAVRAVWYCSSFGQCTTALLK